MYLKTGLLLYVIIALNIIYNFYLPQHECVNVVCVCLKLTQQCSLFMPYGACD